MRTLCGSFGSELCINGMDKMSRHTICVCRTLTAFNFFRGIVKMRPVKNVENLIWLRCKLGHIDVFETRSRCCSIELLQDLSSCLNVRTDYLLNGDAPHNNHLRERLTFLAQELEKITADLPVWV